MIEEKLKTVTCRLCNKDFLVSSDRRICLKCQRETKERGMTVKEILTADDKPDNSSFKYERALNDIKELCRHRDLGTLAPMVTLLRISQIIKTIDIVTEELSCPHKNISPIGICKDCGTTVERRKIIPIPGKRDYPNSKEEYTYFKLTPKGELFPDRRLS